MSEHVKSRTSKSDLFLSFLSMILLVSLSANAQLIVNETNVSASDKQYIQFMYYVSKETFKPVYYIDHGVMEVDINPTTKIQIDGVNVVEDMSPMMVLNMLYKSGWEYMGDMLYLREPMINNWYVYTLRRKE
jgi:hypothetical protein